MKKFIIISSIIVSTFIASSCDKDYLEVSPTASVDAGAAYATTKNATAAINGIYRSMIYRYLSSQGFSGYPALMIISDVIGEDLVFGNASNGWHFNEQRWISHRNEQGLLSQMPYEMFYRVIGNANLGIVNIDAAVGPVVEKNQVKGEALALRAFSYFNLVQLYGKRYAAGGNNSQLGVPLVLEPTTEGLPRSTVEEVYAQINKDLTEAASILSNNRANKSHFNLQIVNGMRARVALAQQKWAEAASFAKLARTGFALMTTTQYQDGFAEINNPEWMWGFDHLEDQSEFFGAFHSYISCNYNSSNIRQTPKAINSLIYNKIPETDIRSKMWVKTPTAANTITPPGGVRVPYHTQKFRLPGTPSTSSQGDVPYMRAGEMYLIEAEALARQGKDSEAATVLAEFAVTRDPAYVKSTSVGATLLEEILFQRRIELWGEGFRFTDLKRMNMPLNRNGANHNPAVAVLFDVPAGDSQWEFLIPRRELDSNSSIVQNPL
jgi:hypothetical protein